MQNFEQLGLGLVAATVTTGAWIPQAYKTVRSRSARDFSWPSLAMLSLGVTLWLGYGLVRGDVALIGANAITLVLLLVIVAVKLRHA